MGLLDALGEHDSPEHDDGDDVGDEEYGHAAKAAMEKFISAVHAKDAEEALHWFCEVDELTAKMTGEDEGEGHEEDEGGQGGGHHALLMMMPKG